MRFAVLALSALVCVGCSDEKSILLSTQPTVLDGEYAGAATFWQYSGTDSAITRTDALTFTFYSDTTYKYSLNVRRLCGGYGYGHILKNSKNLELKNEAYYNMLCAFGLDDIVAGEFTFSGNSRRFELNQEIPEFQFTRRVVLEKK